jgi:hypothetical protein
MCAMITDLHATVLDMYAMRNFADIPLIRVAPGRLTSYRANKDTTMIAYRSAPLRQTPNSLTESASP